jgi:hypothetical protein
MESRKRTKGSGEMSNTVKERNEIRKMLRRLSPKSVERLRSYAMHLELEELEKNEPPLSPEEEACLAVSRAEIAEGKGRPFKDVLTELW